MTGTMLGADPQDLRDFAKDFSRAAQSLLHASSTLTEQINRPNGWRGGDADRFRNTWNSRHRLTIAAMSREFDQLASQLLSQAKEQENASSEASLVPGSGNGGDSGNGDSGPDGEGAQDSLWDMIVNGKDVVDLILGGDGMTIFGGTTKLAEAAAFFRTYAGFDDLAQAMNWAKAGGFFKGLNEVLDGVSVGAWIQKFGSAIDSIPGGMAGLGDKVSWLADPLGKFASGAGRVLGPVGLGLGVISAIDNIADEDYIGAGIDVVSTGLGTAALFTPPPVNLALGAAAGAVAIGGLIYENWDDISAWGNDVATNVQNFATDVGRGVEEVGNNLIEGAGDFANDVAEIANDLWPF